MENFFTSETNFLNKVEEFTQNTEWVTANISDSKVTESEMELVVKTEKGDYPLTVSGKASLPARAGLSGSVLSELTSKDYQQVLNTCFPYKSGNMLLNVYEGSVYAAHSDNYAVLEVNEIFQTANKKLKQMFPTASFLWGSISPDFAMAEYSLANEKSVVEIYEQAFSEFFSKNEEIVAPTIRVVTSNTSESGANVYPCFLRRGSNGENYSILAGEPIKLNHKGDANIEKFEENLAGSFSLIQKTAENIIKLTYLRIEHPVSCFLNICKDLNLPKPASMELADEISAILGGPEVKTHAKFLYLMLTKHLEKARKSSNKEKFNMACNISRMLSLDIQKRDRKFCEWLKGNPNQISFF